MPQSLLCYITPPPLRSACLLASSSADQVFNASEVCCYTYHEQLCIPCHAQVDQTCGPYCSYRLYCCIPYTCFMVLTFMPSKVQLPGLTVLARRQALTHMPNQLPGPFMPFFSLMRYISYICSALCVHCTLYIHFCFGHSSLLLLMSSFARYYASCSSILFMHMFIYFSCLHSCCSSELAH